MGKKPIFNTYDARPFSSRNFLAKKEAQGNNRIKLSPNIEDERIESNENNIVLHASCFSFVHIIKPSCICHHCTSAPSLFLMEMQLLKSVIEYQVIIPDTTNVSSPDYASCLLEPF